MESDTMRGDRMSSQVSIAHYRVTAKIGEGGMGAVYRATDTKLNRDVAIKVLPDVFAADADRMARFTREAQVLASLNHPNIAAIYGVEERALVLELVEGPTLAERIAQGALPLEEAIPIARQIAEALEYAHERGIVHRDLKPANLKVTPEGRVKVLDFGLAKALSREMASGDPALSPTLTMRETLAGVIMGTAGYMSPEQAKGKPVDRRADIWAFGVVLVEMLTARMMYTGETVSETLASVIKDKPDLSMLPEGTPANVRRLAQRCLEKDPMRRLQAIGEARILLDEAPEEAAPAAAPVAMPAAKTTAWRAMAGVATAAALILGGLLWWATRPVERPMQRFSADLGPDAVAGGRTTAVLSPDGSRMVFPVRSVNTQQLATMLLDQSKPTVLPGTDGAADPFFSPDGQWIGFVADNKLKKIAVQGGATVPLCNADTPRGFAWSADGYIYGTLDGLQLSRIPETGGTPEAVSEPAKRGERTHRWPQILPGGDRILVTVGAGANPGSYDDASIGVYSLKTKEMKIVQRGGYYGRYARSGHLLYVHDGGMFAVRFDAKRLETRGMPAPVVQDVAASLGQAAGQFDLSDNGILVYLAGSSTGGGVPILWLDKSGKKETLLAAPLVHPLTPRLSPDGKLLAYAMAGDLYIYDAARGATSRITFDPGGTGMWPVWAPDGKHIAYSRGAGGIWWVRSDGSGKPEAIYDPQKSANVSSISPDGTILAFHQVGTGQDLYTLRLDVSDPDHPKAGSPEPFLSTKGADVVPAFSPDGRWLAYSSNESGSYQVFVRPFPEGAQGSGQAQVSTSPGRFPLWSRTAKEIFYVATDGHIMVAPYGINGRAFSPGKPQVWSDTTIGLSSNFMPWDLASDGKRAVVFPGAAAATGERSSLHVTFLVNFCDELKRRMP
jgi:Tol biopolymer transport system component